MTAVATGRRVAYTTGSPPRPRGVASRRPMRALEVRLRSATRPVEVSPIWLRLAVTGAVVLAAIYPVIGGADAIVALPGFGPRDVAMLGEIAALIALYVPMVLSAARGRRPAAPGWSMAGLAVAITAGFVTIPDHVSLWAGQLHILIVAVVLVVHRPWAWIGAAAVVAVSLAVSLESGLGLTPAVVGTFQTVWRTGVMLTFVWCAVVLGRLSAAREAVTREVLLAERRRIDQELGQTLGTALDGVSARAARLAACVDAVDDKAPGVVVEELEELIERVRSALAQARRIARSYRSASLPSELAATARLLTDAGLPTQVVPLTAQLSAAGEDEVRAALHAAATRLLHNATVRSCELEVLVGDGHARLAVRTEVRS